MKEFSMLHRNKDKVIQIRLSDCLKRECKKKAAAAGINISAWVRELIYSEVSKSQQ